MMRAFRPATLALAVSTLLSLSACVTANSPMVTRGLQMISAGHTGCLPEENQISNMNANLDGSGTWNAACKGKTYLCSSFKGTGTSTSYSCAPVAQ